MPASAAVAASVAPKQLPAQPPLTPSARTLDGGVERELRVRARLKLTEDDVRGHADVGRARHGQHPGEAPGGPDVLELHDGRHRAVGVLAEDDALRLLVHRRGAVAEQATAAEARVGARPKAARPSKAAVTARVK